MHILNADLPTERAVVLKRITDWLKANAMDIFNDEELNITLHIENKTVNNTDEDESSNENDIVATVLCFVCKLSVKILKLASPGHPKRWVFSNCYKHVKIHKGKLTRREENNKIQTIDKFISCVPKKTSTITSSTNQPELISNITKPSISNETQEDFHERRVIEADNSCVLIVPTPNTFNAIVNTEVKKWAKAKYQRIEREKRRRERTLLNDKLPQPLITNFFPILDKVSKLIDENTNLRNLLINSIEDNKTLTLDNKVLNSNILLKYLYECASKNQQNTKNNNRFDEQLKKFSVY